MNKQKVLIVDDNTTNIKFIADTLKELEYISIVFATNGYKAIEIVKSQEIDLILMDINMPELDGFETVKKMDTSIPVIYVTALDDKKSVLKAFDNKGVDYITKPFYPQELISRVTTHLRLIKLNKNLEAEVQDQIEKNKEKEKFLIQQSKLASMGEMIDAIAHQWIQPINLINLRIDLLMQAYENEAVDLEYMNKFREKISGNIEHMLGTLDEFRTFFRPHDKTASFDVKSMIEKVLVLVKDEFLNHKIKVIINEDSSFLINGIENEFKHLILNLLNNAKDAFNENKIPYEKREIIINIKQNDSKKSIEVCDSAGGISEEIINDIFKANITTKKEGKGSGIGLYLSSLIAQKYNGLLTVKNINNGACFIYEENFS